MSARRWPALLVISALIAAMLAIARSSGDEVGTGALEPVVVAPDPMPMAQPANASLSTFYCPSATGGGNTEVDKSVLVLANTTDEVRSGTISAFAGDGSSSEQAFEVGPHSRWSLDTAGLGDNLYLGLLVEVVGGGTAASLVASGDHGTDIVDCPSTASPDWYIPAASTTLDARAVLKLFNPFPDDAVVRVEFATGDEIRVPQGFEGIPIPGQSVVSLDVTDVVTVRANFATAIEARTGKIVAELVQTLDGSEGPEGLVLTTAAPAAEEAWFFPAGNTSTDLSQTFAIYNPNDTDAIVDLGIAVDDPANNGAVLPIEVKVPRRSTSVITSADEIWSRVPPGVGHSASVRSKNGVGVVAGQVLAYTGTSPGITSTVGSPLVGTDWIVPLADPAGSRSAVVVRNPSATEQVHVSVQAESGGATETFEFDLAPAARRSINVDDISAVSPKALLVVSDGPIVTEHLADFRGRGRSMVLGVPVSGATEIPDPLGD